MNDASPVAEILPIPDPGDAATPYLNMREEVQAEMDDRLKCGRDIGTLTGALAAGDESAFGTFHELFYDRLFRYLLVLTQGNESGTRDLLQVTLMKVVRSIKPFADEGHLWQWLKTIARNTFLDSLRQASRTPNLVPLFEADAECCPVTDDADEQRPLIEALDACLAELLPSERDLVDACYNRNLSQQEAATQFNTTAKAVESKLARVRHKLRLAVLKRLRHENS